MSAIAAHSPRADEAPASLLRFITCGSVDDGKSTLIGRLLFETGQVPDDQLETLAIDSKRHGTQGGDMDFALLLDGLSAEREQGITIDVAYRYFATPRRKFIVADTPGHRQYTRNMASGASTADVAILLVDARMGLVAQTRRHGLIVDMLGVRHVVLAINKMDLAGFSFETFTRIEAEFRAFARALGFASVTCVPVSAKGGDNIATASPAMPWYRGPTLLGLLETIDVGADVAAPFHMAVQWVNRPNPDFRGFSGTITAGDARPGDIVRVLPAGRGAQIDRIVTADGDLDHAVAGQAVTVTLTEEIDVSRGDALVAPDDTRFGARRLTARLLWVCETAMAPGRGYILKAGAASVGATLAPPIKTMDIETGLLGVGDMLGVNDIGVVDIATDRPITLDLYRRNRAAGGFILIDRITNETVAMGLVEAIGDADSRAAQRVWRTRPNALPVRSMAKAATWRAAGSLATVALAYGVTGDARISAAIGGVEVLAKFFLYYFHERAWAHLGFGLRHAPGAERG